MTKAQKIRIISRAYTDLRDIENDADLKKQELTLAEYHAAREVFNQVSRPDTKTETVLSGVAEYFKRHGYTVTAGTVNYTIAI